MKPKRIHNQAALFVAIVALGLGACKAGAADFVVIVNKDNDAAIDKATIARIYTGNMRMWSDGTVVVAVDLKDDDAVRAKFCSQMMGKTVGNLRAIWAQLIFSGKALPPKQLTSDEDVKKYVSANRGGVGYIKPGSIDATIKVAIQ